MLNEQKIISCFGKILLCSCFLKDGYETKELQKSKRYIKKQLNDNEINNFLIEFKDEIIECCSNLFTDILFTPIHFSLEELIEIQASDNPFTDEELYSIMCDELNRENYVDINCDVVDYCIENLPINNLNLQ